LGEFVSLCLECPLALDAVGDVLDRGDEPVEVTVVVQRGHVGHDVTALAGRCLDNVLLVSDWFTGLFDPVDCDITLRTDLTGIGQDIEPLRRWLLALDLRRLYTHDAGGLLVQTANRQVRVAHQDADRTRLENPADEVALGLETVLAFDPVCYIPDDTTNADHLAVLELWVPAESYPARLVVTGEHPHLQVERVTGLDSPVERIVDPLPVVRMVEFPDTVEP
jgi:hypothetical protein